MARDRPDFNCGRARQDPRARPHPGTYEETVDGRPQGPLGADGSHDPEAPR